MRQVLFAALVGWVAATAARAAVVGRVETPEGVPIEHARIVQGESGATLFADSAGRFTVDSAETPLELTISHPRFYSATVLLDDQAEELVVVLEPKQEIFQEIAVSANRGEGGFTPMSVASEVIDPTETTVPPMTLAEVVTQSSSVSENGQGGIFQTYSIRGVSRQRVMTLVSGVRVVSERRAGVSASFIDPHLMGSIDVLRGPSSTYYGSGALGGVIQLFPRRFNRPAVELGYSTESDSNVAAVGWGSEGWSLGLAHRRADEAETPAGEKLNTGFTQTSGVLQKSWKAAELDWDLSVLASSGRDIGKSNSDFPERRTDYPQEDHLVLRLGVASDEGWHLEAYAHPNELQTNVTRVDRLELLDNEALDLGVNWTKELSINDRTSGRFGADYFARRGVTAEQTDQDLTAPGSPILRRQRTLDDGYEDELGAFGAVEWNVGEAVIVAGGRLSWQQQGNEGSSKTDDSALTAFAGVVAPVAQGVELAANVGTGLRFPSLSERFFSGITGRGNVTGNPDLDSERSVTGDLGLRVYGKRLFLAAYVFRNEIDDYIERIEVAPDELTFVNLTSGTIDGLELEGFFRVVPSWVVSFGGHAMTGRDDGGAPLADIPSERLFLGSRNTLSRWSVAARFEHRFSKDDPGSGEMKIGGADLLSGAVSFRWREGLVVSLSGRNLLDEEYFNSADDKAALSPGRSVALSLSWSRS